MKLIDFIISFVMWVILSYLLTNGMDKLCIWDMRPYTPQNRCVKILEGHQHNFKKNLLKCSWSPDGSKVTAGSYISFLATLDLSMNVFSLATTKALLSSTKETVFKDFHERRALKVLCESRFQFVSYLSFLLAF